MSRFSLSSPFALFQSIVASDQEATNSSTSSSSGGAINNSSTSLSLSPAANSQPASIFSEIQQQQQQQQQQQHRQQKQAFKYHHTPPSLGNNETTKQISKHLLELQREIKEEEDEIFADINSLINDRSNLYSSSFDVDDFEDNGVAINGGLVSVGQTNNSAIAGELARVSRLIAETPSNGSPVCLRDKARPIGLETYDCFEPIGCDEYELRSAHSSKAELSPSVELRNQVKDEANGVLEDDDILEQQQSQLELDDGQHEENHQQLRQNHHHHHQQQQQQQHHHHHHYRLGLKTEHDDHDADNDDDQCRNIVDDDDNHQDEGQQQQQKLQREEGEEDKEEQSFQEALQRQQRDIQELTSNLPKPCVFFLEGNCRRSDCKFSHDLSSIICKYWIEGFCFKGEMCPFSHSLTPKGHEMAGLLNDENREHSSEKPLNPTFAIESEADFPSLPLDGPTGLGGLLGDGAIQLKGSKQGALTKTIKNQILNSNPSVVFKTTKKKRKKG